MKLFTLLMTLVNVMTFSPVALAYTDVGAATPTDQRAAIEQLSSDSLVKGYTDGSFRPTQHVNRAEFLNVLMGATKRVTTSNFHRCFADFKNSEQWYWEAACAAKDANLIGGYPDGTFGGDRWINLAEALKITVNAFGLPLPDYFRQPDHWYDPYFDAASSKGIFPGITRDASHLLTRGEMALLIQHFRGTPVACEGHAVGETYTSSDGCNKCSCTKTGAVCTLMACSKNSCTSSNDCPSGQRCSTERGDCQAFCPPGMMCPAVCKGVCEAK